LLTNLRKAVWPISEDFEDIAPVDEDEREIAFLAVDRSLDANERVTEFIIEHVAITTRWIFASLVTINGAAALAAGSSTSIANDVKAAALEAFIVGIILAVLAGYASAMSASMMMGPVGRTSGLLLEMRRKGVLSSELQARFRRSAIQARAQGVVVFAVGAASLAAFAIGALRAAGLN
jgi:hypothetical protein